MLFKRLGTIAQLTLVRRRRGEERGGGGGEGEDKFMVLANTQYVSDLRIWFT